MAQTVGELDEESLQRLYEWIDEIPLSRPKRTITRDFSDGMLVAEVIQHYFPKMVDLHNFSPASSSNQKLNNWGVLQRKIFSRLKMSVPEPVVRAISNNKPGVVEMVLLQLKQKIEARLASRTASNGASTPSSDAPEVEANGSVSVKVQVGGSDTSSLHALLKSAFGDSINVTQTVPRVLYEEKEQECLAKDETIQILQAKMRRLEHLLQLKETRVKEMTDRIELLETAAKNNPMALFRGGDDFSRSTN